MQAAGIGNPSLHPSVENACGEIPSLPISGIDPDRHGMPMTYENLQDLVTGKSKSNSLNSATQRGGSTSSPHSGESPDVPSESSSTWDTNMQSVLDNNKGVSPNATSSSIFNQIGLSQFVPSASTVSGATQVNQENNMQFPIRSSTPTTQQTPPPPGFPWTSTGVVIGVGLEQRDLRDVGLTPGRNGWSLPEGSSSEQQKLPAEHPEGGDVGSVWCPFAERQRNG